MRDAFGSLISIQVILAFVLLINGYLAYSVNYTRAFRVKNGIINIIEQYEGHTEAAKDKISTYTDDMKYHVPAEMMNTESLRDYECIQTEGYCIKKTAVAATDPTRDGYRGAYYSVVTFVNIDIPVLNKFIRLGSFLQVKGETKTIYSTGTDSELE